MAPGGGPELSAAEALELVAWEEEYLWLKLGILVLEVHPQRWTPTSLKEAL
jgi:hypothetical protein